MAGADHALGDHQLEQVGAVVELRSGGLPHAVGALGVQPDVPAVAVRPGDPRAGGEDARAGRGARGDRVAQLEAERRDPADLARRRDAVPEQRRGALCRAPQLVHMRQVDGVVERVRGGVEGEVGMRVDEAGDRGRAASVEGRRRRGRGRSRRSARSWMRTSTPSRITPAPSMRRRLRISMSSSSRPFAAVPTGLMLSRAPTYDAWMRHPRRARGGQTVTAAANVAIGAESLVREFPGIRAVAGIDLAVERGQVFGFLGANGSGKTTHHPHADHAAAPHRRPRLRRRPRRAARPHRGATPHRRRAAGGGPRRPPDGARAPHAQGRLHGVPRSQIAARAAELLAIVDLEDAADRRIGTYSGGMQRRSTSPRRSCTGPASSSSTSRRAGSTRSAATRCGATSSSSTARTA